MVVRITGILSAVLMLTLSVETRPAASEGWSLPNPFASQQTKDATKKKAASKPAQKEPSVLEKAATGTKNFFGKVGETLTGKKSEPKKPPTYAYPKPPALRKPQKPSNSWLGSWFKSEEPPKDKTVTDWMNKPRLDP